MSEIKKKQSKKEEMPSSNSSQSFVTLEDRARAFNLGAILLEKIQERQLKATQQTKE